MPVWVVLSLVGLLLGSFMCPWVTLVAGLAMERVLGVNDLCDLITQSFPFSLP